MCQRPATPRPNLVEGGSREPRVRYTYDPCMVFVTVHIGAEQPCLLMSHLLGRDSGWMVAEPGEAGLVAGLPHIPIERISHAVADPVGALQSVLWASLFADKTHAVLDEAARVLAAAESRDPSIDSAIRRICRSHSGPIEMPELAA